MILNLKNSLLWLMLAVITLVAYRLLVIELMALPLFYDEAYYFYWSLTPDWGYFSKPPVVAWLIAATTALFSVTELSIKLSSAVLYGATAMLVYAIAMQLYNQRVAMLAGLIFISMPLISFNSLFITTDAPLLFFWALTLWFFIRALATDDWGYWIGAGVAGGLGLLSKYSMMLLPLSILLYLLLSKEHRHQLGNGKLWLGFALAALIYLPNLYWNMQHEFISFQHTREISQLDREWLHPDKLFEFLAGQSISFGLISMAIYGLMISRKTSYADGRLRLLLTLSLPYLLLFSLLAFVSRANQNWAAPVYISAAIVVAVWLAEQRRHNWLAVLLGFNLVLMLCFYHYHQVLNFAGIEPRKGNDPYHRVLGWSELGGKLAAWQQQYPQAGLLSNSRKILAYFGFYGRPGFNRDLAAWNPSQHIKHQYDLVADLAEQPDGAWLFVSETPLTTEVLARFTHAEQIAVEQVAVYPDLTRTIHIYLVQGFQGYGFEEA